MSVKNGYLLLIVLALSIFLVASVYASELSVEFERTPAVSIDNARIVESSAQSIRLAGQLKRPYKLAMPGHVHVYMYSDSGEVIADSKHKVSGLNSARKGMLRVPFNISIEMDIVDMTKAFLVYHTPGHSEG